MIQESLLKMFSLGYVAKDIPEDEVYIDIYPIELHPNIDGEITTPNPIEHDAVDSDGNIDSLVVIKTTLIKAKWVPFGDTNRLEPPTVCKGETVVLYRYGDTDKYYWTTLYNELDKRKLEKRTIILSNKQSIEIDNSELLEKTYYVTIDTINKSIHLHTDDSDGEYTTYDIAIDTASGVLTVIDGKENMIELNSSEDTLTINTNSKINTNTTDATHYTSNDIVNNVDNNKTNNISNDKTNNIGNNKTDNIGSRYQINLSTFAVSNGGDELLKILTDFVQATSDAIGIGNLGAPVPMDGGTKSALAGIKARIEGFM